MAKRYKNKRKKFKDGPGIKVTRVQGTVAPNGDLMFREVSTVNSYLYTTRPYPFNPDEVVGKKGLRKYTEIYRDEQVKAAILAKQFAVIGPGWEIQPAQYEGDSENKTAQEIARLVQQNFDDMEGAFDNKLLEMLSAYVYGFSIAEKLFFLMDKGEFGGKIGLKDLKFRMPIGFEFQTDPFGNLLPNGVMQAIRPLPADKFLIYSYRKRFSNYYGDSDLRECYRPWWAKDNAIKFMMIVLERYGEPTWIFNVKGALARGNVSSLENFMKDIQNKSGLILPDNIEADPKFPAPQAARNFLPVLEYLDGLIRAALGMPSLIGPSTTESSTGSLARAQTQQEMFLNLMQFLRADVETNINEQVIRQLVDFNYNITDGKYPQFKFKDITAEEEQRQFDNYNKAMTSKSLTKTREDEIYFREKMDLPALPDDYPVAGEVTPEMQAELDARSAETHQATMDNMKTKAEGSGSGGSGGGFPPKKNSEKRVDVRNHSEHPKADKTCTCGEGPWCDDDNCCYCYNCGGQDFGPPHVPAVEEKTFESESDLHKREYVEYKNKQALQFHLINNDRNRDLMGPEAVHVSTLMPKMTSIQYLDVPGVDQMHGEMGIDPTLDTDPKKYHSAKAKFFKSQPKRRVDMGQMTFTQAHVHSGRVEEMSSDAAALNEPVQMIKSGIQHYLMDGHHRVMARHKTGKKFVMANVYEAPKKTFAEPERHDHKQTEFEKRVDFARAKKVLDTSEAGIRIRLGAELKKIEAESLEWFKNNGDKLTSDQVKEFSIDAGEDFQRILTDMFENAWTDGRDAGASELPPKIRKSAKVVSVQTFQVANPLYKPTWLEGKIAPDRSYWYWKPWVELAMNRFGAKDYANAFEPTEALAAFGNRAWLIKDVVDSAIQSQIRYELFEHLKGGRTLGETMDNMRKIFEPWVGDPAKIAPESTIMTAFRLENIIRTETTWAYNQGRLAMGDAAGDYVIGYQFSAVLDDRTTDTCRRADGLIFRKDAPSSIKLTPPLHYQCRSILVFVTEDDVPVKWSTARQVNRAVELIPRGFQ